MDASFEHDDTRPARGPCPARHSIERRAVDRPAVLITDDDAALRETLRATIESCGVRTMLAADGVEALEIVQQGPVHVAVFDMHMPRLTGLEAMLRMRSMGFDLPCILMTGRLDERLRRAAGEAKAFSLLSKPVSRKVIVGSVQRALEIQARWLLPGRQGTAESSEPPSRG